MSLRLTYFIIILIAFSISCKQDSPGFTSTKDNEEKIYFEDYESPKFKWGYIDKSGRLVHKAVYDDTRDYSEGLASVNYKGKWGYIDPQGKPTIDFLYRAAYNFSEGLALVQEMDKSYYFIDKSGVKVFDCPYDEVNNFSNGLARVKLNGMYGFVNKVGKLIIENRFIKSTNYRNGYASVTSENYSGIIDTLGKVIIELEYDKAHLPSDEVIRLKKGKNFIYYYLVKKKFSSRNYNLAADYHEGVAAIKSDKWYLIDKSENIISLGFEKIEWGGENMWFYRKDGKTGILNANGETITEAKYDLLYRFSEGLAGYSINDQWGYIDKNGIELTPPLFPLIWGHKNGLARAIFNRGVGFLDSDCKIAIPAIFYEVRDFYQGYARVQMFN